MEQLIRETTAYKAFCGDVAKNAVSHAYMLHLPDEINLKKALKIFAVKFFEGNLRAVSLVEKETFSDCKFYPEDGKKITVDGISEIVEDTNLKPLEGNKKLYVLVGFDKASALVQNKLLKILEEPPQGIHFLLGVTTVAPVLATVKSRVKTLEIVPFSERAILAALNRNYLDEEKNSQVAKACGGIYGNAEAMLKGEWYSKIREAALEICLANTPEKAGIAAAKYGDTKQKNELLSEMERLYFSALCVYAGKPCDEDSRAVYNKWKKPTLIFATQEITKAAADVKFNTYFSGLLYSFAIRVIQENEKWKR
ncbi:MAG: hypothetical protein J6B04_05225 [Clostridia bacterium]|nr:hypothetical protein [Clostridia bacterium]